MNITKNLTVHWSCNHFLATRKELHCKNRTTMEIKFLEFCRWNIKVPHINISPVSKKKKKTINYLWKTVSVAKKFIPKDTIYIYIYEAEISQFFPGIHTVDMNNLPFCWSVKWGEGPGILIVLASFSSSTFQMRTVLSLDPETNRVYPEVISFPSLYGY